LLIRFWGTRGSLPKPGQTTLRHGGNTSCVELRAVDGTLIVLDCGTGAHGLGQRLATSGQALRGHLLITHTHWDHIQGFPFFAPLFIGRSRWDIYGPGGLGRSLKTTLAGQMNRSYFPVALSDLGAAMRFHDLDEGRFTIGGVRVEVQRLNHPAPTFGYRLHADGVSVVYAVDHEPYDGGGTTRPLHRWAPGHPGDRRHIAFLEGADLIIHDAQYTVEEYPAKLGWGHTPVERAVDYALAAGARRLALFHHDPLRDDEAIDRLLVVCRERAARAGGGLYIFAAAEGQELALLPREMMSPPRAIAYPPPADLRRSIAAY
jgi:phosphoribosyl 1,2-cyclic phosphodiesterase